MKFNRNFLGIVISIAIPKVLGWNTAISSTAITVSVIFSVTVGVFFGYYSARKTANFNPIGALQF